MKLNIFFSGRVNTYDSGRRFIWQSLMDEIDCTRNISSADMDSSVPVKPPISKNDFLSYAKFWPDPEKYSFQPAKPVFAIKIQKKSINW